MKDLIPPRRPGFFEFTPAHLNRLLGGFLLIGFMFGFLLGYRSYEVSTDPYSFHFGNTTENPWVYTSPAVYLSISISCFILDLVGIALLILGQLKENKNRSLIGLGFIVLCIAASAASGLLVD